jgi:signal peptidase I
MKNRKSHRRLAFVIGGIVALLAVSTALAAFFPPFHQLLTSAVPPLSNVLPGSDAVVAISGPSMEPTLRPGQLAHMNNYSAGVNPQRGDIVTFHMPGQPNGINIKRVIGLPGETVVVTPSEVTINGQPLPEPYVAPGGNGDVGTFTNVTLGPNQYFLLGDNRQDSEDSRIFGPVARTAILAKMVSVS